jgi:hypothetical protein
MMMGGFNCCGGVIEHPATIRPRPNPFQAFETGSEHFAAMNLAAAASSDYCNLSYAWRLVQCIGD